MDVTSEEFESLVIDRSHEVPVLVDFWAEWCGPCRALAPVLETAVNEREGTVALAKVDVDANQPLAQEYGVSGIPAVKAFKDGRVVDEFVGALSPTAIEAFLDRLLAPPRSDALVDDLRAHGELPELVAAFDRGDVEGLLAVAVDATLAAEGEERTRFQSLTVAFFERYGQDDDRVAQARRRLASGLY